MHRSGCLHIISLSQMPPQGLFTSFHMFASSLVVTASLAAQMVKNLPAMQETWVQSLGWEDPVEEGMVTHSSILSWRIPMDGGAWRAIVNGIVELYATEWLSTAHLQKWFGARSLTSWFQSKEIIH